MRLRVLIGLFSTAWGWLKGALAKIAAAAPKGILFVLRKRSRSGDEFDLLFSTHDAETVARLLQGFSAPLLKQLPAAVGGDCPRAPYTAANIEPLPAQLPSFF